MRTHLQRWLRGGIAAAALAASAALAAPADSYPDRPVTLVVGFGRSEAEVLGPVLPGVSRWRASLDYLVVPGNVGDERLLVDLVDRALGE